MLKFDVNGHYKKGGWDLTVLGGTSKGRMEIEIINHEKWHYEKGYRKAIFRTVTKAKTIRIEGVIFDLSEVLGMENF
jgi:hypothetical protein